MPCKLPLDVKFLDSGLLQQSLDILWRLLWNGETSIISLLQAISMELAATTNDISLRAFVFHVARVCLESIQYTTRAGRLIIARSTNIS